MPLRFLLLAKRVVLHADPGRFDLLYRLLWRLTRGERRLLDRVTDRDVAKAEVMARAVQRAAHKMQAFLRFREVWTRAGPRYVAWFEPEHYVLELTAPFFAQRFAAMRWVIVTPYRSAVWDGTTVAFGPAGHRDDVPAADALDEDWRAYYAAVFDPARANPRLMRRHMPKRYWRDLPETRDVPALLAEAGPRADAMVAAGPSEPSPKGRVLPLHPRHREPAAEAARPATLAAAREAASGCRACPLWEPATRTVFGEGPEDARAHAGRRAAGRLGGPGGPPLRRPRGPAARQSARRGRPRPLEALPDERGQALQVQAATASAASTSAPTRARSRPAAPGSASSATCCAPASSWPWAPPPPAPSSAAR